MIRSACVLSAVAMVLGNGAMLAQRRTVPKQFDNVRTLGRALAEFQDDRVQVVVSYATSQVNHDSRWLLIEFGALGRTKTTIDRFRIELITPEGRFIPHATLARVREAGDLSGVLLQTAASSSRLYWYLPYDGLCCPKSFRFQFGNFYTSDHNMELDSRGPVWADLLFESPVDSWDTGKYALVVPYDGAEAFLPIELRGSAEIGEAPISASTILGLASCGSRAWEHYHKIVRSIFVTESRPVSAIAISNSCRRIVMTRSTP